MTRLVYSFIVVTLWIMPAIDSYGSHPPTDSLQSHPPTDNYRSHPPTDRLQSHPPTDSLQSQPPSDEDQKFTLVDEDQKFSLVDDTKSSSNKRIEYSKHIRKVPNIPPKGPMCDDSNVIEKFTSKFTEKIFSKGLSELYETSLPLKEAEEAYYRTIYHALNNVHASSPRAVSRKVSDAVRNTFGHLNIKGHVQSYGHTVAAYMKSRKVLTCENLKELVHAYVSFNKQSAENIQHARNRGPACIQAISNSLAHFLSSLNLYTADTVRKIFDDYADFLYQATGVPQRYSHSHFKTIDETV